MSNSFSLFQFSLFILKNVKNYSLIIFYFFLLLFSLDIQTEIICEKKNIYGHILYIYLCTKNFLPERNVNYFQCWQFLEHSDNFLYYYIVSLQLY